MAASAGQIARYMVLPGIWPRIKALFATGFSHVALYIAYVFRGVRLLPQYHPYLDINNTGRFGIRHVVFEAKRHLVYSKENIDQIIIFYSILIGVVILFAQFAFLLANVLVEPVFAASNDYRTFFALPNSLNPHGTTYDIALRLLDLTFGFETPYKIFDTCVINKAQCQLAFTPGGGYAPVGVNSVGTTQFHTALHTMFHFYNFGICAVAFMVGIYMFVTVIGETAQSGTPFGRRFNGMWAPLRLIIAIAMLTPLSWGMNGAQLTTLVIAKWGSNMASNGWHYFMTDMGNIPLQQTAPYWPAGPSSYVGKPNAPELDQLVEFMFVAQTCRASEYHLNQRGVAGKPHVEAYQVFQGGGGGLNRNALSTENGAGPDVAPVNDGDTFAQLLARSGNDDIVIRFGPRDTNFRHYKGHVKPICGEIILTVKGVDDTVTPGAYEMQEFYYNLVMDMWTDGLSYFYANNMALRSLPIADRDPFATIPNNAYVQSVTELWEQDLDIAINDARTAQIGAPWADEYSVLGWGGAGIWYQKIAEYTGSLFSAVSGVPTPHLYPSVMEHVKEQRRLQNDFVEGLERYNPVLSDGEEVEWEEPRDKHLAFTMYAAQKLWWAPQQTATGETLTDTILSIFGLNGLFSMRCNQDVHPLAQLVGAGRSLVESAVTNLGFTFGGVIAGSVLDGHLVGSVAKSAAGFTGKIAMIGLSIGFILFYIVPFLPFIYFFFAVGGWVKGIFEAMVGLPLFAIAHIRIDGEGLPGPVAMNGYFLIFEIFARPILIIFGLLAGIIIFTAQVQILNEIWGLVTSNVFGATSIGTPCLGTPLATDAGVGPPVGSIDYLRGHADQFFYTIMYAILIYMLAMASFKMIDLIPNNILRWVGASVSTFGEQTGDPAAKLVQYSYMGSNIALGPINQGIDGITSRAMPFL